MSFIQKIAFRNSIEDVELAKRIQSLTGFKPKDINLYKTAFTHKSENKTDKNGNTLNYERLEFLGDALLDSSVTTFLFKSLPNSKEGELTQMRSKIVSRNNLNRVGKDLNLVSFAKKPTSKRKFSYNAHGDFFEALVAAVYLDRGYEKMDQFIHSKLIEKYVDLDELVGKITSYKSLFIEWCQKKQYAYEYISFDDTGNSKIKHFGVKLMVNQKIIAKARATSKKKAEELASRRAFYKFQKKIEDNT